ncbi:putative Mg(2+) transport ATPase [Clostridium acetireducens DSM 10703]|jgi:putative Mg2+ transporter-C (MgtC) family protein|uniref:Putative Mg(2+) transport ATPase n=1 Tax=Clostridium acetireducens DSM 10703 TaxID=1121290 RepID=A0A1E8EZ52_9CLOT|nr:MgtC/SapB family protein [Clostridium acetireducens]OFI06155.1 putative Mg(2+) transport ATPase [Clostridium acetireducens DSM 10703]
MDKYEVLIKLLLAIIIGGAVGYERESRNRPAGFRTHILVCMGAAIISMIEVSSLANVANIITENPKLAPHFKIELGRLGAQVISGIGFLGAGTIIHEKGSVKGLTTAASLWVVACIGLAIGVGHYYLSIVSGICAGIVLVTLKRVEDKVHFIRRKTYKLEIEYYNSKQASEKIIEYFETKDIKIKNIEFSLEDGECELYGVEDKNNISIYTILVPKNFKIGKVLKDLANEEEIIRINII